MSALPGLTTRCLGRSFVHLDEVDSTNNYCKDNAATLPHGAVVLADFQTGGKGRLGKSWSNPRGHTLSFSILLKENIRLEDMTLLPLLAGLGVCRGLDSLCGLEFAIKWSNDVLCQGKKVCGILCESRISAAGSELSAVIGIGVNLLQTCEDFAQLDLVYANSLFLATGRSYLPEQAASAVLNELEPVLDSFIAGGFQPLREAYKARCITLGRQVLIRQNEVEQEVFARDIAPDGSLLCTMADGKTQKINAGETSVRGIYGYA